jgi:hypothetical protein
VLSRPRHKPELICALRPFRTWRARGRRTTPPPARGGARRAGLRGGGGGTAHRRRASAFGALYAIAPAERQAAVAAARARPRRAARDAAFALLVQLAEAWPGDVAARSPAAAPARGLAPGEARSSRRASCTATSTASLWSDGELGRRGARRAQRQPVDAAELLALARFGGPPPRASPRAPARTASALAPDCAEFALAALRVSPDAPAQVGTSGGVELLLCSAGALAVGRRGLPLRAGEAALVPAAAGPQRVAGSGETFRVFVPLL